MASQLKTIAQIIDIAKISQVLAANNVGGDISKFGKAPDTSIHTKIYMERKAVEFLYDFHPAESYTRRAADYLYALCFPFNKEAEKIQSDLAQDPPTVTGPSDATVAEGATASFTIVVTSALAYTVKWFKDGVLIPGATSTTYSFTAALGDSGSNYNAVVTSVAGSAISVNGLLTVTTVLTGSVYVGDTDYTANLLIGFDNVDYIDTFNIEDGEPLSISLPTSGELGNNRFHVYRYPKAQGLKVTWYNTPVNNGQIPDQAFIDDGDGNMIEIGDYYYIVSRGQISVDVTVPMIFS
jgi:hypothetical protein